MAVATGILSGQTAADHNAGMRVEHDPVTNANTVSWWGIEDHAYFIMTSDDLINWQYINIIFVGQDAIEDSFNFTLSSTDKSAFFKLQYTDQPVSNPAAVGDLDFDGDSLTNQTELDNNADPFAQDTDGDGLRDDLDIVNGQSAQVKDHPDLAFSVLNY